jgi:hypothetical protein
MHIRNHDLRIPWYVQVRSRMGEHDEAASSYVERSGLPFALASAKAERRPPTADYNDLPLLQVVPQDPQACTVAVIDMALPTDNNLRDTSETLTSPATRTRGLKVACWGAPDALPARTTHPNARKARIARG